MLKDEIILRRNSFMETHYITKRSLWKSCWSKLNA